MAEESAQRDRLYELVEDALSRVKQTREMLALESSKHMIAETMAVVDAVIDWLHEVGAGDLATSIGQSDPPCRHGISFLECDICLRALQADLDELELENPQVRDAAIRFQDTIEKLTDPDDESNK